MNPFKGLYYCFKFQLFSWGMFRVFSKYSYIPFIKTDKCHGSFKYLCGDNGKSYKPYIIEIGSGILKQELSMVFLHEIGHLMDYLESNGYYYTMKFKPYETKITEKNAWKNAIKLSNQYNIPIDKKVAQKWLSSYGLKSAFLNKL